MFEESRRVLLNGGVLRDGLGALGNGVLGQLAGKNETNSSLNFAGRHSCSLTVTSEATGLRGNPAEDVVHERVHDAHSLGTDPSLAVNLLENTVDVDAITLLACTLALLLSSSNLRGCGLRRAFNVSLGNDGSRLELCENQRM